jgi:general secretion pathway protein H
VSLGQKTTLFAPGTLGGARCSDPAFLDDMAPGAPEMRTGGRAARIAGFTLLEILVVILIIGIVSAAMLMTMNFTGRDTQLSTESQRLLALMKYARDQAELQTRNYGIVFSRHGYEFVVYGVRSGVWRQVFEDDALRERQLPKGLEFKLVVDARPIVLHQKLETPPTGRKKKPSAAPPAGSDSGSGSDSDSTEFAPQVMIFSSGDLSSFKVTLERPAAGRSIVIEENQDGDIVEKKMIERGS